MSGLINAKTVIGVSIGAGISAAAAFYHWYQQRSKQIPPEHWKLVGTVEEICIFPIKSCGGIELPSAFCDILGLQHENIKDRMFMLIDKEDNKLVTSRGYPKLIKIQPKIMGGQLILSAPEITDLEIDFKEIAEGKTIKTNVWGSQVNVIECGSKYDNWFSKYLNYDEGVKLVYYPYPMPTKPIVSKIFKNGIFQKDDTGSLQDVSSYMLINGNSVNDLNLKLENKVHPRQFRGNFVIKTTGPPYDEDNWQWIKIGENTIFRSLAPCYRCIVPNVNAFTGERDPNCEPLKTLESYRVSKTTSPEFGLQLGLRTPGVVKKGDPVYVEEISH